MNEKELNKEQEEILAEQEANADATDEKSEADTLSNDELADNESEDEKQDNEEHDADAEIAKLQAQIADLHDKYLRQVAEFDNYRKRTLKERAELILNGGEKVLTTLLPVLDDMERAIQNGEKTDDVTVLREGMELIYHKLVKVLEGNGVTKIETADADFDTDIHEAVAMVPGMGDDKKGKVIDCLVNGYKLNDKVIRHAKVAVGQ
jgi:molecular chaperone GrpE